MNIRKKINFLSLPVAILAYLSGTITPLASHPVEKWSRNYTCGEYDITVIIIFQPMVDQLIMSIVFLLQ